MRQKREYNEIAVIHLIDGNKQYIDKDNDHDCVNKGRLLPQTVFPDENGEVKKLRKRKNITLYYDPVGSKNYNGVELKEPVKVTYRSDYPIDLTSVRYVKFDKSFKKAKFLTDTDMYIFHQLPNFEEIDVTNVRHVSNYYDYFKD